ncbi:MAG: four helix bundle protein, partial [Proteobacteria bacterium]|nr:four helix bundle protein [Pseudomonadota bacterium]
DMFCHEKLEVYQKSVEFLKEVISVIRLLPNGNSDIVNQLRRAATSISLNIAEGAGKTGVADKKRYYSIARGSTLECAAIFDLLKAWNLVDQSVLKTPTSLLSSLAAMLSKLVFKV